MRMVRRIEEKRMTKRTRDCNMVPLTVRKMETKAMTSLRRVIELSQ